MVANPDDVDVVIVGGGHNGLVAAAYLARAGLRVRLLERLAQVGGAAVSSQIFDGVDARLSRYAYLVSLLPGRIVDDLGAAVRLARRPYSSYTPDPATAGRTGLLVGPHCTFGAIDAHDDERAVAAFYRRCRLVTERLWPTLLEPLRTREQARRDVVGGGDREAAAAWRAMVERPIGHAIADAIDNDLVRGVVATDALIGTFARLDDPLLQQNVCFLYHLLGGGDGEWHVPVGGMGAVSAALARWSRNYHRRRGLRCRPGRRGALPPARRRAAGARPICAGRCHTDGAGQSAGHAITGTGSWCSGKGQHGAATVAAIVGRQRDARAGVRRYGPRQRDLVTAGRGICAGRGRSAAATASV